MIDNEALRSGECNDILPELSAYIDGELPEEDARRIEAHLEKCEKCRELMSELLSLSEDIAAASVPYPADLHLRIMASLNEEMAKSRKKSKILSLGKSMKKHGKWIGAGVAAVICIALIGSPVFRGDFAFGMDDAKNLAAEADAVEPQNGCAEVASEMTKSSATGSSFYAADEAEASEAKVEHHSTYSLADGNEMPQIIEKAPTEKSDADDMSTEEVTAESEKIFEYDLVPSFMLPRGELGTKKTELDH